MRPGSRASDPSKPAIHSLKQQLRIPPEIPFKKTSLSSCIKLKGYGLILHQNTLNNPYNPKKKQKSGSSCQERWNQSEHLKGLKLEFDTVGKADTTPIFILFNQENGANRAFKKTIRLLQGERKKDPCRLHAQNPFWTFPPWRLKRTQNSIHCPSLDSPPQWEVISLPMRSPQTIGNYRFEDQRTCPR